MADPLPQPDRDRLAETHPGWSLTPGRDAIAREWRFADFGAAWAFLTRVALLAERRDHHPEISNTYNRVRLVLTTHDAGGLSTRDLDFARAIDTF